MEVCCTGSCDAVRTGDSSLRFYGGERRSCMFWMLEGRLLLRGSRHVFFLVLRDGELRFGHFLDDWRNRPDRFRLASSRF